MATARKNRQVRELNLEDMVAESPEKSYEALQLYRSKINRLKQKNLLDEALNVAFKGSVAMLTHKYYKSGLELTIIAIDLLEENDREITVEYRNWINRIDDHLRPCTSERLEFLKKCVKLSIQTGSRQLGDTMIHSKIADCLWESDQKMKAVQHYAIGEAPEQLCIKVFSPFIYYYY